MSDIEMKVPLPLDDDAFLRRQCPLCREEFKILLTPNELTDIAQKGVRSFMLDDENAGEELDSQTKPEPDFTCPYCGQKAPSTEWWTEEQLAYVMVFARNIAAQLINEHLIRPLHQSSGHHQSGFISVEFKGRELEMEDPWISPEVNEMEARELPCCQRKEKVKEAGDKAVYCFFCGFPYRKGAA